MSNANEPNAEVQDVPPAPRRGRRSLAEMTAGQDPVALEAEMAEDRRLKLVDERYGDDLPFDVHRVENEIIFYFKRSAESYFEAGKKLIQLKEHVGHGGFMSSLERMGIEQSVANKTMFTVRKFVEARAANSDSIRILSPSKLYEVALLDPADIEELGAGGMVAGKTFDDLEKMTVREIKETFRKEREDRKSKDAAREDVIKSKNDKIDELERQLRGTPEKTPRELSQIRLCELERLAKVALLEIEMQSRSLLAIFDQARRLPGVDIYQINAWTAEVQNGGAIMVNARWTGVVEALDALYPVKEGEDVPALG